MARRDRTTAERRGVAWRLAIALVKPVVLATTKRDWDGIERIPASGGCLIVVNHISEIDPLTLAHIVYERGRLPRYLAKAELFDLPVLGRWLRALGQIPVARMSREAAGAYDAAVDAIRDGRCVVVYPEGTLTRDPDGWPMIGKTGAARIALATRCPVIPIGQWGAQEILPAYARRPDLVPRKTIHMLVGDPIDLGDLTHPAGHQDGPRQVGEATTRIMSTLCDLVGQIRQQTPPSELFDPRAHGVPPIGNPTIDHDLKGRAS
jgi:1-acyl-sn-glycerol-3-phosphate acyltransferase